MQTRRQVTEEDVRRTEAQIARSYGRLKRSVARAPSRALGSLGGSLGGTAREHPAGTAAAAVVAGVAMYGLFRLVTRPKNRSGREPGHRPDATMELLRMLVPLATPYIAGYLEKYVGQMVSGNRR